MACFHTYNNITHRQKSQTLQPIRSNPDREFIMNGFLSDVNSVESCQEPGNYADGVNPDASEETLPMQSRSNTMRLSPNSRSRLPHHHQYHMHQLEPVNVYTNLRRTERLDLEQQVIQIQDANQHQQRNLHHPPPNQFYQHHHMYPYQHSHHSPRLHQSHKQLVEPATSCRGREQSSAATTLDQDNYYNLATVPKLIRQQSGHLAGNSLQNSSVSSERKTTFDNLKEFSPLPQTKQQTPTRVPTSQLDTMTMMRIYCALGQLDSCPPMPQSRNYSIASSSDSCLLFKVGFPHRRYLRESYTDLNTGVCLPAGSVVYIIRCSELDRSKFTVSFSDQLPPIDVPHKLTDIARPVMARH